MADDNILFSGDAPSPSLSSPSMHDMDEDGEVCRICRLPGSVGDPLRYPCVCRGSIKYVHEECLLQWLSVDNKRHCEVCRHTFSFSPIYADHTPVKIPFYEIVTWGATKAPSLLLLFLRLACVIFVWFIIVPFTTRRVWRMALTIKTLAEGWAFLFDYSFTIVDSLVGLLCFVGMNMLSCICLSLIMYYSHRQPTNQRPRNGDAFVGEMEVVIVLPFEVHHSTLAELFGMEGSMYPFFKRLSRDLACHAAVTIGLVAIPIYLGRMILYSTSTPNLYALVMGYIPIFGLCFIYLRRRQLKGLAAAILSCCWKCLARTEPLMTGNMSVGRAIPYFLRKFLVAIIPVMTFLKVGTFLVIELLIFSFVLGCWLDACTVEVWGVSIKYRIELFYYHPLRSYMYYLVLGLCHMFLVSNFISHVEKVLHTSLPILSWDIRHRIPNSDQINTLAVEHISNLSLRLLLSISFDSMVVVILIFLPVRLAVRLAPSIFPLDLTFPNIIHNIHEFVALLLVYIPFVAHHICDFHFGDTIRALLHHWFAVVGWAIGLANCSVTKNSGIIEEIGNAAIENDSSGNVNYSEVSPISFKGEPQNYILLLRIMLMLVLSWTTLLLLNTTMLVVPASIGRAVFNAIPYPEDFNVIWHNDFYTISVGLYIMWKCIVTATKVVHCIKDRDVLLGPEIWKMGSTALKCLTLFFIWVSVIPLLSGLLLDLITAPLVVPVDETQILFWHIDWANGSLCFYIWLSMVGYQMIQDSERFQRLCTNLVLLEEHGFSHFTWSSAIGETIFSIISLLLTGLCVPYVFAKGIFPLFGYTVLANSVAYLYAWLGFLLLYMVWSCVAKLPSWVARVQNFIKDDRYVIGRRVDNYHV